MISLSQLCWALARCDWDRALRLNPFDPSAFEAHLALGVSALRALQYDEAVACFARGWQINRRHNLFPFFHAIALALVGRAAEAAPSFQRGFELEPGFRLRIFSEFGMAQAVAEKFVAGGRLLVLPE